MKARPKHARDDRGRVVVTTGVAAKALGISLQQVLRYCRAGIIAHYRLPGGRMRIRWDDVLAFAERYPAHASLVRDYSLEHGMTLEPLPEARVLTIGQASRYFGVDAKTVTNWCEDGELECYRIPRRDGTPGYRRILAKHARAFAERHGIPVAEIAGLDE